jgi:hypothetical protein
MMNKMGVKLTNPLFVLIATMAISLAIEGQVVTAAISGKIEDPSGAGIGGATVTVKSVETGATRVVTTDDAGDFKALSLPLGPQEVKAEKTGFRTQVRTGIKLEVGQEAVVNLQLQLGDIIDRIEVSEAIPVVNTTTSSVSGLVGDRAVKELPLNGRSFDNLITLNPGSLNYVLKSPQTTTSNGNTFAVSGREPSENVVMLNGIEYTGTSQLAVTPGGVSGQLLGIDAVREFNGVTNAYSAEYGKRAGAQVSVVTQSGGGWTASFYFTEAPSNGRQTEGSSMLREWVKTI